MKKLKQLFCMLLVAAMVAGMLPTTAFASGSAYRPGAGGNGNTPGMTLEQFAAQTALLQKNYPAGEKNEWTADPMGQDGTDEEDDLADFATGRVIVKSYEKITDKEAVAVAGPYKGIYVFQYADAAAAQLAYERFLLMPEAEYAQPSHMSRVSGTGYTNFETWGYEQVGFSFIHDYVADTYGENVEDIVVAVIDSGIDFDHPLFDGRIVDGGYDFVNDDDDPLDDHMHGTAVSGVIVSSTPEFVKILPIKSGNEGGGLETTDIYLGIQHAIAQGADIINMSFTGLGEESWWSLEHEAIVEAKAAGIVLVGAYGNDSKDTEDAYPAAFPEVIAVSAVDCEQNLSSFSNYGKSVDVCAPGTQIYTAYPTYMDESGYQYVDGTSFACPFTAAAVAMLMAANPEASADEITALLYSNTNDLGEPGHDKYFGYGMISFDHYSSEICSAAIGGQRYSTFDEAYAAAVEGDTIVLMDDLVLSEKLTIDKTIAIHANDLTISRGGEYDGDLIEILSGCTLTLGSVDDVRTALSVDGGGRAVEGSLVRICEGAQLILGGLVELSNNHTSGCGGAIYNEGTVRLYAARISGNAADQKGSGIYNASGAQLFVSGQMSMADDNVVYLCEDALITVDQPLHPDLTMATLELEQYADAAVAVIYENNCTPSRKQFALTDSAYMLEISGSQLILRSQPENEARIGEHTYATLEDALASAQDGDRIVLLRDVTIDQSIEISNTLTLSADGEYWLERGDALTDDMIIVREGGSLTLDSEHDAMRGLCISGGAFEVSAASVLVENGGALTMKNVYITNSYSVVSGRSAVTIAEGASAVVDGAVIIRNTALEGGGIYNAGELTIQSGTVSENNAFLYAGGIANYGTLVMTGGEIRDNETLYWGGGITNAGEFTLDGGAITGNICSYTDELFYFLEDYGGGGGVWNGGVMTMNGGTISENSCWIQGGGILNSARWDEIQGCLFDHAVLYLNGGSIERNRSESENDSGWVNGHGGGILNRGKLYMDGGEIAENVAQTAGGGIFNIGDFYLTDGIVFQNTGRLDTGAIVNCGKLSMTGGMVGDNQCGVDETNLAGIEALTCVEIKTYQLLEEIQAVTQLTGGTIRSSRFTFRSATLTVIGPGAHLEMGGDLVLESEIVIKPVDAVIEIVEEFSNENPPIGILAAKYPAAGQVLVSCRDDVEPDVDQFFDVLGCTLEQNGRNIVLTSDSPNISASGQIPDSDIYWELEDHVLTISGLGGAPSYTECVPWFSNVASVHEVRVEAGVTFLWNILWDHFNVKTVSLPYSLVTGDGHTFVNCSSLECVRFVGDFNGFSDLTFLNCGTVTIQYPEGNETWESGFGNTYGAENIIWEPYPLTVWEGWTFDKESGTILAYQGEAGEVEIPREIDGTTVRELSDDALRERTDITAVFVPGTIKHIPTAAFYQCRGLKSVTLEDGVTSIGMMSLWGCMALESIQIPDSVTEIGSGAFFECSNLQTVYYGGIEEEWNEIAIGGNNQYLLNANIVFGGVRYQITLDANGGKLADGVDTLACNKSGKLTELPTPERAGYIFNGWFTEREGGEQVDENTVFTADATIYAHWTLIEYAGGDVNGDGKVNSRDAVVLLSAITQGNLNDAQRAAADVNGDGEITTRDAINLLKAIASRTTDQL